MRVILLMMMMMTVVRSRRSYSVPRVQMIQRQSCFYTPFDKQLTCHCTNNESNTFLKLRLMFFIKEKGQEVRRVQIKQCEDVMLGLDLTGVNPLDIPISFKNCGKVSFSYINFDQQFSGGQILKLEIDTVTSLALEGLDVTDALQISADRVKELILRRNRFNHIPLPGLEIINADKLVITDNYFHRISAGSITIKTAKVVEVINNQFSVNAVKVVKSSEGSRFYISCNRLLGAPQSPECVPTPTTTPYPPPTTTRRTTTTLPTTSTTTMETTSERFDLMRTTDDETKSFLSEELLIGLVVGVAVLVLLLLAVVIILCCKKKKAKAKIVSNNVGEDAEKHDILVEKDEDQDSGNNSSESLPEQSPDPERESLIQTETVNPLIEAAKPKFSSPVWLDEIQNNKIFTKQKSINTETETPRREKKSFPVRSISEIIDTESEHEDDTRAVAHDATDSSNINNNEQSKVESDGDKQALHERKTQETDL